MDHIHHPLHNTITDIMTNMSGHNSEPQASTSKDKDWTSSTNVPPRAETSSQWRHHWSPQNNGDSASSGESMRGNTGAFWRPRERTSMPVMGAFGPTAYTHQHSANNQGHTAHQFTNPTSTSSTSTTRTPDMMPLLGAKMAPAKFRGKYDTVKRFIRQYKQMCAVYNVPDRDKCQRIIDYCSSRVTWFIEALDSFINEDWDQLEKDILTYYDAELHESRYLLSDLDKLVEHWRKRGIYNLKWFKQYEV